LPDLPAHKRGVRTLKITGLDNLTKNLQDLDKKAKALQGTHPIPLDELLTPAFVSKHTRFASAEDLFEASGFRIESQEDFAAIPDDKWDEFIRSVSPFSDWHAMLEAAVGPWTAKKLGL
jgi:hypothetical protein